MKPMWHISGRLGNQMFQYAYLYSQVRRGKLPDVYLQDEEYFKEFSDELKRLYGENIGTISGYVSIHVRRGDYVRLKHFYVDLFEDGYYERAMAQFPNKTFVVFSDDIEWCKQQPIFKNCLFSEGKDEIGDMNFMASCEHNIIANSSFSWWAAWLNPNPNKKIIAPKKWFTLSSPNDGENYVESTKIPKEWIRV